MPVTDIDVINGALRKLGVDAIATLADDVNAARVATDTYSMLLDAVLTDAPWDFATTRAELTAHETSPDFGFDNAFDLPDGDPDAFCLRVREIVNVNEYQWVVEQAQILTSHESPIQVIYTARVVDEALYTPQFIEALQSRLAAEWAEPLIASSSVQEVMMRAYNAKISAAKTIEAGQTGLHADTTNGSWVDSRVG
jgi:hypothetical protein